MSKPRILVLGAGGTGGYFGGRLAESGADVTFLVRDGRRKILSEQGLRIESPFGDAQVAVKTVLAPEVAAIYDAVILTCKAYDLDAAIAAIAPAVAPTGYVLPFLNGIVHIDILNEKFGRHRVLGGTAKIQATITPNGVIRQFNDWRTLTFGEQSGEMTERVRTMALLFEAAKGVEVLAVADILQRMWDKLVHLSTAAAVTCLMRANVGEIVRTPHGRELFLDQLRCGAAIAAANGHAPSGNRGRRRFPSRIRNIRCRCCATSNGADRQRWSTSLASCSTGRSRRKSPVTHCCSPTPTSRLSSNGGPQAAYPDLPANLREPISPEAVELKGRALHRGQLRIGRKETSS